MDTPHIQKWITYLSQGMDKTNPLTKSFFDRRKGILYACSIGAIAIGACMESTTIEVLASSNPLELTDNLIVENPILEEMRNWRIPETLLDHYDRERIETFFHKDTPGCFYFIAFLNDELCPPNVDPRLFVRNEMHKWVSWIEEEDN